MIKKKLPLGIQTFSKIREGDYHYVDKTARIYELITTTDVVFLSRPRRFGKSLLCSTLGSIFEGRRDLFSDLAIDSLSWEWKKYPVVRIDLNPGDYAQGIGELNATINTALNQCAKKYDVSLEGDSISSCFVNLLTNLHLKYNERVAVIIDEYDKPLLSTLDDKDIHEKIRNALKGFYGVLKSQDEHLKFVFLTGVTKFSKVSIFSDLNNLSDISLDPRYADICGITQEELESEFAEEIKQCSINYSGDTNYLDKLKTYYNGYRFTRVALTVYNPFGLLHHFYNNGEFQPYWFESGSPAFLIKLIEQQKIDILKLENKEIPIDEFSAYNADTMAAVPILYQSGYLTIVNYSELDYIYTLDFPNDEVRISFARSLSRVYAGVPSEDQGALVRDLYKALKSGDVDEFIKTLRPFYQGIPFDILSRVEHAYQLIFYVIVRMLGIYCKVEVHNATGSIDAVIKAGEYIFVIEFKLNGNAEDALAQINNKDYALSYEGEGKKIIKLGIEFDNEKRNIGRYLVA
ncbi:ATPase AAA [Spirochaetia bacterium]|nr:ATPase AAA [Spirochaetia bacterium]